MVKWCAHKWKNGMCMYVFCIYINMPKKYTSKSKSFFRVETIPTLNIQTPDTLLCAHKGLHAHSASPYPSRNNKDSMNLHDMQCTLTHALMLHQMFVSKHRNSNCSRHIEAMYGLTWGLTIKQQQKKNKIKKNKQKTVHNPGLDP